MQEHVVRQVPLVDVDGAVAGLVVLDKLIPASDDPPMQAVIMAGGFGTRLRPLTDDVPKPMLPLGDYPLMEHIVRQLQTAGIRRVHVTTHYKPEKIIDHFGNGDRFGMEFNYIAEDRPLGTAGALGLMDSPTERLLVMNGDILTSVDFKALLNYHQENAAVLTVGARQYEFKVPYGVIEREGPFVRRVVEKPSLTFFVNAGIYLLEPEAHGYIPRGQHFDMTDLIGKLIEHGQSVACFPILEYWLDIGQLNDYEKAVQDVKTGRFAA
jgi:NDP-sugar pyrophosphorylase family protein